MNTALVNAFTLIAKASKTEVKDTPSISPPDTPILFGYKPESFESDIPLNIAQAAHSGTSFSPEHRGLQERSSYSQTLYNDLSTLSKYANAPDKEPILLEEFGRYRTGYRRRYLLYLASRSRVMSAMIAGPSKFPFRANEKKQRSTVNKLDELTAFRERALDSIRKTLCPELRPIMSGDSDAIQRLQEKLTEAEEYQKRMKDINTAHKAFLKNPLSLDRLSLSDSDKTLIRTYKPTYTWEPHPFAPFQLQNNSANIRRIKERLNAVISAKSLAQTEINGSVALLEDCPAENRIRLRFSSKPDAMLRAKLKASGFRWAPTLGVWQAYRNHRAMTNGKEIAGV
jgi:hypothetical protein